MSQVNADSPSQMPMACLADVNDICLQVHVKTRERITPDQGRQSTQVMHQTLREDSTFLLDRPSGDIIIEDGSRELVGQEDMLVVYDEL
jgi:hypothetical protein